MPISHDVFLINESTKKNNFPSFRNDSVPICARKCTQPTRAAGGGYDLGSCTTNGVESTRPPALRITELAVGCSVV